MSIVTIVGFALVMGHTAFSDILPSVRYARNGGLRFVHIGRLHLSFSISRKV